MRNNNIIWNDIANPHWLKVWDVVSWRCGYLGRNGYICYTWPRWFWKTITKICRDKYWYNWRSYQVDDQTRWPFSELDAYEINQSVFPEKFRLFK